MRRGGGAGKTIKNERTENQNRLMERHVVVAVVVVEGKTIEARWWRQDRSFDLLSKD